MYCPDHRGKQTGPDTLSTDCRQDRQTRDQPSGVRPRECHMALCSAPSNQAPDRCLGDQQHRQLPDQAESVLRKVGSSPTSGSHDCCETSHIPHVRCPEDRLVAATSAVLHPAVWLELHDVRHGVPLPRGVARPSGLRSTRGILHLWSGRSELSGGWAPSAPAHSGKPRREWGSVPAPFLFCTRRGDDRRCRPPTRVPITPRTFPHQDNENPGTPVEPRGVSWR